MRSRDGQQEGDLADYGRISGRVSDTIVLDQAADSSRSMLTPSTDADGFCMFSRASLSPSIRMHSMRASVVCVYAKIHCTFKALTYIYVL